MPADDALAEDTLMVQSNVQFVIPVSGQRAHGHSTSRSPRQNPRHHILLNEGLNDPKMKLGHRGATRKEQARFAVDLGGLVEELHLLLEAELAALVIVDELDAFDELGLVVLDALLRTGQRHQVELRVGVSAHVLEQVCFYEPHDGMDVLVDEKRAHVSGLGSDLVVLVIRALVLMPPLSNRVIKQIDLRSNFLPFCVGLDGVEALAQLENFVLL